MSKSFEFRKVEGQLVPIDRAGREKIDSLSNGVIVKVTISRLRSNRNHNQFFAFLSHIVRGDDTFKSIDHLLLVLKQAEGLLRYEKSPLTGQFIITDGSISFDEMSEDQFKSFKEKSINRICEYYSHDVFNDFLTAEKPEARAA